MSCGPICSNDLDIFVHNYLRIWLKLGGNAHTPSSPCSALIIRGKLRLSLAQQDARWMLVSEHSLHNSQQPHRSAPRCIPGVTADIIVTKELTNSSITQQSIWWPTGQSHGNTTATTFALQQQMLRCFIMCNIKDHTSAPEMEKN